MRRAWWQFWRREEEFAEEMASHLAMAIQERVARGESIENATAAARREFGNREVVRATTRDMWGWVWLEQIALDFRYAVRKLRLAPGFTAVAALSLAIGIGATVTMYAVVDAADIRALPYPNADRLVAMEEIGTAKVGGGAFREFGSGVSAETFATWHRSTHAFDAMTLVTLRDVFLMQNEENERLSLPEVGAEFFSILGGVPLIGRGIVPSDTNPDAPAVVVLSQRFWMERFRGDRGVIGRPLQLTRTEELTSPRETYTIVGVMPEKIDYPGAAQGWIAARSGPPAGRSDGISHALARLRQGQTLESARAELSAVERGITRANTGPFRATGIRVQSLRARLRAGQPNDPVAMDSVKGRAVRLAVVFFVLLIAVINVGNLLLARSAYRDHEVAVRVALGASRWRLAQQILVEGGCIALLGGSIGVAVAWWGTKFTASIGDLARQGIVPSVDLRVALFAVVLSIAVALGIGFIPMLSLIRAAGDSHRSESPRITVGRTRAGVSGLLLVGQIGAALTLLTGAGLLGRELLRLDARGYDYDPTNMIWVPNGQTFHGQSADVRREFRAEALARLKRIPGVVSVSDLELCGCNGFFPLEDKTKITRFLISAISVSPGFLTNLRIPLRRGRDFTESDFATSAPVAIISSDAAGRFWPDEDPIGKQVVVTPGISFRPDPKPDSAHLTVVGVMGNPNFLGALGSPPLTLIRPMTAAIGMDGYMVRVTPDSAATIAAVRRTFATLRGAPLTRDTYGSAQKMVIDKQLAEQRLTTRALLAFAAVAVLLATLGLHGLVAYSVAQRTREIGIRMALGAESRSVLLLVTRRGLGLAAAGIALGLAGSLVLTGMLRAMLYGTSPTDPVVFAGSAMLLATVVLVASYLPARRATRVDPMIALRVD